MTMLNVEFILGLAGVAALTLAIAGILFAVKPSDDR